MSKLCHPKHNDDIDSDNWPMIFQLVCKWYFTFVAVQLLSHV